ncbi:hypothetical protein BDK51DRAFT_35012, partial [Blyttiomyces helicus]
MQHTHAAFRSGYISLLSSWTQSAWIPTLRRRKKVLFSWFKDPEEDGAGGWDDATSTAVGGGGGAVLQSVDLHSPNVRSFHIGESEVVPQTKDMVALVQQSPEAIITTGCLAAVVFLPVQDGPIGGFRRKQGITGRSIQEVKDRFGGSFQARASMAHAVDAIQGRFGPDKQHEISAVARHWVGELGSISGQLVVRRHIRKQEQALEVHGDPARDSLVILRLLLLLRCPQQQPPDFITIFTPEPVCLPVALTPITYLLLCCESAYGRQLAVGVLCSFAVAFGDPRMKLPKTDNIKKGNCRDQRQRRRQLYRHHLDQLTASTWSRSFSTPGMSAKSDKVTPALELLKMM